MRLLALAAMIASLVAATAAEGVLFKWLDADGKTQYSDKPPKGYKGEVVRIESEPAPPLPPPVRKIEAPKAADSVAREKAVDPLTLRREKRAALEANVSRARENVEAARAALESAGNPQSDELQTVRNRVDNRGGRSGAQVARSNCRQAVGPDGKKVTYCPGVVPTAEYYERIAKLEEDLRKAEEALDIAQQAYRRGAD